VEKYSLLSQAVLANHTAQRYDADSLALNAKLLELNPEVYTAWNFRKRCLGVLLPTLPPADGATALEKELQLVRAPNPPPPPACFVFPRQSRRSPLPASTRAEARPETRRHGAQTQAALRKNPKSYGTWHHRRWVVCQGHCSLERELVLCTQLLDLDERNFHCWSYRRCVSPAGGALSALDGCRTRRYSDAKVANRYV
jgi:geranylgeranyl transferase type-2 subunit alpha